MKKKEVFGVSSPLLNLQPSFEEKLESAKKLNRLKLDDLVLCVCQVTEACNFKNRTYVETVFGDIVPKENDSRNFYIECAGSCGFCGVLLEKDFVGEIVFY